MTNIPQHRADAPIVFVSSSDPAWDNKRVAEEMRGLSGDALAGHIVGVYMRGESRGDITAPDSEGRTVIEYLDDDFEGVELRRIGIVDVARCRDQSGRVGQLAAARLAYDGKIDDLAEERGAEFVFELGEFALRCSEAPRPGEFKRSGS